MPQISLTLYPVKRVALYILLFVASLAAYAGGENAGVEVSVLTCSPGREVYSLYGHTAIHSTLTSTSTTSASSTAPEPPTAAPT